VAFSTNTLSIPEAGSLSLLGDWCDGDAGAAAGLTGSRRASAVADCGRCWPMFWTGAQWAAGLSRDRFRSRGGSVRAVGGERGLDSSRGSRRIGVAKFRSHRIGK
jgi:hypothetical protein